jgi:hypothetical protein
VSVPEEIRKVPRPINTVVIRNSKAGPFEYAVKERKKPVYRSGKTPSPRNGAVIGHIYHGRFIPLVEQLASKKPTFKSFGPSALLKSVSTDIFEDLTKCYALNDACAILTLACLKVIRSKVPYSRMAGLYEKHFISEYYPNVPLSKNKISGLLKAVGMDAAKQRDFFKLRLDRCEMHDHIAIDGMLKTNDSVVNDLSAFSYKGRIKGCQDISVLYAYDVEKMEPICSEVFPGNCIDAQSYRSFIRDNCITKGIIIADKGFPPAKIHQELEANKDLHFLTPIKRNDRRIAELKLTDFENTLTGVGKSIVYSKRRDANGRFLYAFRDTATAAQEESCYIKYAERKDNFEAEAYQKHRNRFGLIVFESDHDLDPKIIYKCYEDRWLLEIVFRRYKNAVCLNQTAVQSDYSVYGSEFVNFLATLLTIRIIRKADAAGILKEATYYDLMDELGSAWRNITAGTEVKDTDDQWVHTNLKVMKLMVALGLVESDTANAAPKKRGRPRKQPETDAPKKKRGRPKKTA